jgi:hypothetical protein
MVESGPESGQRGALMEIRQRMVAAAMKRDCVPQPRLASNSEDAANTETRTSEGWPRSLLPT